jgi:hypothetical protein
MSDEDRLAEEARGLDRRLEPQPGRAIVPAQTFLGLIEGVAEESGESPSEESVHRGVENGSDGIYAELPDIRLDQVSKGVSHPMEVENGDTAWSQDPPDLLDGQTLICVWDHDLAKHSVAAAAAKR